MPEPMALSLIHVEGVNIDGGFFEDDFMVDANGQNFFTVTAINGQLITVHQFDGALTARCLKT